MVPHKSWGTMDNDVNAKHTWTDEECDEVVGGPSKKNCDGIPISNITFYNLLMY